MPANQFFTDWVTGETITAAKLNTMKNSVQPYLGYTPVNKAGDTMTGALSLPQANTTAGTSGAGNRHIELQTSGLRWALGLGGNESGSNTGANFFLWRYDDAGNYLGEAFGVERNSGRVAFNEISGRYDHQNRFVVQGQLGGTTSVLLSPGSYHSLSWIYIYIPSGKRLYLKRLRYVFSSAALTVNVFCQGYSYTSSLSYGDISLDVAMSNIGAGNVISYIRAYNPTSNDVNIVPTDTVWAELEIR